MPFPPQVEQWRPTFRRLGSDLPQDFLLAWLTKESGGNPCATGIPGVEAGVFQTFHPADDKFGATFAQLRALCSGQNLTQAMTSEFASLQANSGLNFVRGKRNAARAHLAAVGARWSESSKDFWTAVKQEHALPCVMGDLLPRVTSALGRPPRSWGEFRNAVMSMSPSQMGSGCAGFAASSSVRGLRSRLEDTLVNAEEVGQFGGGLLGGTLVKVALAAAFGVAAYMIAKD